MELHGRPRWIDVFWCFNYRCNESYVLQLKFPCIQWRDNLKYAQTNVINHYKTQTDGHRTNNERLGPPLTPTKHQVLRRSDQVLRKENPSRGENGSHTFKLPPF